MSGSRILRSTIRARQGQPATGEQSPLVPFVPCNQQVRDAGRRSHQFPLVEPLQTTLARREDGVGETQHSLKGVALVLDGGTDHLRKEKGSAILVCGFANR
jgi:hypothetical protein